MSDVQPPRISVVTPTLHRPQDVNDLLDNLRQQTCLPHELILVDGASPDITETEKIVQARAASLPYGCRYIRHGGGTAIQRNVGLEVLEGDFVAFIDDDIRLEPDFFEIILAVYHDDQHHEVGGIAGYITNQYLDPAKSSRWRWYRRLKLFSTYEPGRYDFQTGYPINRYMQAPHEGIREIDFMGTNCALWRREVIDRGLRFSEFFSGFGVLEDAHFALRARVHWKLLEVGRARCVHLRSPLGRENPRLVARKTAINYRYVFVDIVPKRTWNQEFRFWRVQFFDLFRFIGTALRGSAGGWPTVRGKIEGIWAAFKIRAEH